MDDQAVDRKLNVVKDELCKIISEAEGLSREDLVNFVVDQALDKINLGHKIARQIQELENDEKVEFFNKIRALCHKAK